MSDRFTSILLTAVVGCIGTAILWIVGAMPARAAEFADPTPADVRPIYLRDCATCHGADARGTDRGPDLRGTGTGLIDYYLSTGRMPLGSPDDKVVRHDPAYTPRTIRALVEYVHSLAGGDGPAIPALDPHAGNVADGGQLYRFNCAACHAWSGNGGALLHRDAPSVHPASPTEIAEAVRGGPGNMPAFGEAAFTRRQLDSVVRYVRYLDAPDDRGGSPLWHFGPLAEGAVAIVLGMGALVLAIRWIGTRT